MSTEAWVALGAVCVFVGGAFVYAMLMVFLPEWVGIAGKAAREAERSHRGEHRGEHQGEHQGEEDGARSWLDRMHDLPSAAAKRGRNGGGEGAGDSNKPIQTK